MNLETVTKEEYKDYSATKGLIALLRIDTFQAALYYRNLKVLGVLLSGIGIFFAGVTSYSLLKIPYTERHTHLYALSFGLIAGGGYLFKRAKNKMKNVIDEFWKEADMLASDKNYQKVNKFFGE